MRNSKSKFMAVIMALLLTGCATIQRGLGRQDPAAGDRKAAAEVQGNSGAAVEKSGDSGKAPATAENKQESGKAPAAEGQSLGETLKNALGVAVAVSIIAANIALIVLVAAL